MVGPTHGTGMMWTQSTTSRTRCYGGICGGFTQRQPTAFRTRSNSRTIYKNTLPIRAMQNDEHRQEQPTNELPNRIEQTLAGLDALLGIQDEEKNENPLKDDETPEIPKQMAVSVAPEVLRAIAEAESKRNEASASSSPEVTKKVSDSIGRIVEQAKKLSESAQEEENTAGEAAIRKEFETLLSVLTTPRGIDQNELKILKDKVFGAQTFWMTETAPIPGISEGIIVRGNFRGPREEKFAEVCSRMEQLFGDKYTVRLVEERDVESTSFGGEPRIVIQIIPTAVVVPPSTAGWQKGAAVFLFALTLGSSIQLGLAANIGLLPPETLAWLANPANINADVLPPGLESFDPLPWLQSAALVGGYALLPQLAHEIGHFAMAAAKGIRLGPIFLVPNGQIGTFGSIVQLKSLVKNRRDLFDFAASGLIAGGVASTVLFLAGLLSSQGVGSADAGLVPIPSSLFQGSLLLGGLSKLVLGTEAVARSNIMVSPLLIGGWCGLVATAFNALPVGNLDGGRTMLSAFGRNTLAFSSLLSYVGLGLGLLGSSLALPFGLYVLICQREAEQNLQDEVSEVDGKRKGLTLALIAFAILVLLPGIPDATDLGVLGSPANFL